MNTYNHDARSVLIVEDDVTLMPFWRSVLLELDPEIEFDWAESFQEARHKILRRGDKNEYDIVIVDIFLSGRKTGLDLWNEFCDKEKFSRHPFLIVSGLSKEKFQAKIRRGESTPAYLSKPLTIDSAKNAVDRLLWFA